MVNVVDKILKHLSIDDVADIAERPEVWFPEPRDEEGRIVEVRAWAHPEEDWPTLEFLLRSGFSELEARERLSRSRRLEFLLEYWGTPFAPKAALRFPKEAKVLEEASEK